MEAQREGVQKRTGSGVVVWVEGDAAHCHTIAFLFDIRQEDEMKVSLEQHRQSVDTS